MKTIRQGKQPRVAILLDGPYSTHAEMLTGMLMFSKMRAQWTTEIRMGRLGESVSHNFDRNPVDGLVVAGRFTAILRAAAKRGIPTVAIDPFARSAGLAILLICDNDAVARLAAAHLFSAGLRNFAFMPEPSGQAFSRVRQKSFASAVAAHPGAAFRTYRSGASLSRWLLELPKPVGVFAADDIRARQVSDAAHAIGLKIPDEVAIIGVDNDRILCETTTPALSSVWMRTQDAAFRCAELLHDIMTNGRPVPHEPMVVKYSGEIVARQSTRFVETHDSLALRCCELLEANLHTPLRIGSLLPVLHVSRRTLETRFKATVGRTVHEELMRMRIERAKTLLKDNSLSQARVAEACGFHDASHLNDAFRKHVNALPSAFRPKAFQICGRRRLPAPARCRSGS